jgi:hypothetical protein
VRRQRGVLVQVGERVERSAAARAAVVSSSKRRRLRTITPAAASP